MVAVSLKKKTGLRRVLAGAIHAGGFSLRPVMLTAQERRNACGGFAGEVYTRFGQLDFAAELSSLRDAAPDAVFTFYPGEMGVQFVKQYSQLGLLDKIPLYTVWTVDQLSLPAIGDAVAGAGRRLSAARGPREAAGDAGSADTSGAD